MIDTVRGCSATTMRIAVKLPKKFKFAGHRLPYDHRHRTSSDTGVPYLFESPQGLLEDFFAEVDRVIREAGK